MTVPSGSSVPAARGGLQPDPPGQSVQPSEGAGISQDELCHQRRSNPWTTAQRPGQSALRDEPHCRSGLSMVVTDKTVWLGADWRLFQQAPSRAAATAIWCVRSSVQPLGRWPPACMPPMGYCLQLGPESVMLSGDAVFQPIEGLRHQLILGSAPMPQASLAKRFRC